MRTAAVFVSGTFTDWIMNLALYSILILLLGWILLRLLKNKPAPLLSGLCLVLTAVLLILPLGSIMFSTNARPVAELILPLTAGFADYPENGRIFPATDPASSGISKDQAQKAAEKSVISLDNDPFIYYGTGVVNILGLIWLGGFVILFLKLVSDSIRLYLFRRNLAQCHVPDWEQISQVLRQAFPKTKLPKILTSPAVNSPITCGILDPVVILPPDLLYLCSPAELKSILLHEIAHIHHFDLALGYILRFLSAFYWWNPLTCYVRRIFSHTREEISDNHAIQVSGPLEFSRSLVFLAEKLSDEHRAPACPALATSKISLEQRIRRILSGKNKIQVRLNKPHRWTLAAAACLVSVLIMLNPWALTADRNDRVVALLAGLKDPTSITVDGSDIFITEKESVSIYSLEDYSLVRRFGKAGDKPGEFSLLPHLTAYPDFLLIGNMGKLSFFTRTGDFIRDIRIPFRYFYMYFPMLPVEENYIGCNIAKNQEGKFVYSAVIYDSDFNLIREFYQGGPPQLLPPPKPGTALSEKVLFEPIFDCLDIAFHNNRIYVADTRKGFHIEVFDKNGDRLKIIQRDFEKIPVPESWVDEYKQNIRSAPDREILLQRFDLKFRKFCPAFYSFKVRENKMFFTTYKQKNGLFEIIEMSLEGDIHKRSYSFPLHPLRRVLSGINSFTAEYDIRQDGLYYLEQNSQNSYLLHKLSLD